MKRAKVNGVEIEYEVKGTGEPVLLISPVVADGFVPFLSAPGLIDSYRLIRYHRRGWSGSTHSAPPVTIQDHVADAAALLEHLEVASAHVSGHSSGGSIAMELAFERPDLVHSLSLLEPSLFSVPSAPSLFERAAPSLQAYSDGEHEKAVTGFLTLVSGLEPAACRAVLNEHVPGGIAQAIEDADTFFGIELPSLGAWDFAAEQAATITVPVLSVVGADTDRLWVDVAELLRRWFPHLEQLTIDGVGHFLHMQRPGQVARGLAEFLRRHAMVNAALA